MTSVSEEIQQLQLIILELEKQQKELEENDKKTSIYYDVANVQVLKTLLYLNGMQLILHWHFSSYKHLKKNKYRKTQS